MAKQLTLEKIFRKDGTVYGNKLLFSPLTVKMDRPGNQFLTGPALTVNQHRAIRRSYFGYDPVDLLHLSALANDIVKSVFFLQFLAQIDVFELEGPLLKRLFNDDGDFIGCKGLRI